MLNSLSDRDKLLYEYKGSCHYSYILAIKICRAVRFLPLLIKQVIYEKDKYNVTLDSSLVQIIVM